MSESGITVCIYADGAASPNPGPGGYGAIVDRQGHRTELSRGFRNTTNNRMELLGVIDAILSLRADGCDITVYSDSRYVVDMFNGGYARKWRSRGWLRDERHRAENVDLWAALLDLGDRHQIRFEWIRGHADHVENERCDRLAVAARQQPDLPPDDAYENALRSKPRQTVFDW